MELLEKARALPVGTIRTHGGVKVQKQADGKWRPMKASPAAQLSLFAQEAKRAEAPKPQQTAPTPSKLTKEELKTLKDAKLYPGTMKSPTAEALVDRGLLYRSGDWYPITDQGRDALTAGLKAAEEERKAKRREQYAAKKAAQEEPSAPEPEPPKLKQEEPSAPEPAGTMGGHEQRGDSHYVDTAFINGASQAIKDAGIANYPALDHLGFGDFELKVHDKSVIFSRTGAAAPGHFKGREHVMRGDPELIEQLLGATGHRDAGDSAAPVSEEVDPTTPATSSREHFEGKAFAASEVVEGSAPYRPGDALSQEHNSPETAYHIDDYPYGRRTRTVMRVWMETDPKKGQRAVTQTKNPKTGRWNNPKKSTYSELRGMKMDENGHIEHFGLPPYPSPEKVERFKEQMGDQMSDQQAEMLERIVKEAAVVNSLEWRISVSQPGMEKSMGKLENWLQKSISEREEDDEETEDKVKKASNDGTQPPVVLEYEMEKSLQNLKAFAQGEELRKSDGQGGFPEMNGATGLPSSRGGKEGGELAGAGETKGSVTPSNVNDQPHGGQGPGQYGAKKAEKFSEDDAEPEKQMTEHEKPIAKLKKSFRHEREVAISKLRTAAQGGGYVYGFGIGNAPAPEPAREELAKSEPQHKEWTVGDVYYSDAEDRRIAAMMDTPLRESAVIDMDRGKLLHKSESCPHCGLQKSMILSSCEHCGVQTAPTPKQGITVTPRSNQGMFRRPRAEAPLRAPNGIPTKIDLE